MSNDSHQMQQGSGFLRDAGINWSLAWLLVGLVVAVLFLTFVFSGSNEEVERTDQYDSLIYNPRQSDAPTNDTGRDGSGSDLDIGTPTP